MTLKEVGRKHMLGWRPWTTCFRKVTGYQGDSKYFHVLILLLVLLFLFWFVFCNEMKVKSESGSVISISLLSHGLYSPWNSPGQNTRVGSLSLLQGIFPIQGSNSGLLYCREILYQLSHQGSPRILEWVACPFSRGSSRASNWTLGSPALQADSLPI